MPGRFYWRQARAFQQFVYTPRAAGSQSPTPGRSAADAKLVCALVLEQCHDDGVAFEETFVAPYFASSLLTVIKVKAEVRGRSCFFHQRAREREEFARPLQDHMVNNPIFGRFSGLPAAGTRKIRWAESFAILSSLTRLMLRNRRRGLPVRAGRGDSSKVVEKTRGKRPRSEPRHTKPPFDGGKQPVGIQPAFGDDFFNSARFFAEYQRILDLLRVYPWA